MKNRGEILAAIIKNYRDCYFFLHNTKDLSTVEKIIKEGIIFENQLLHSTDRVNPNEKVEVSYFLLQRKDYGLYTIVIAIPKNTYDFYCSLSNAEGIGVEDVITISEPYLGDNDEMIYTLSPKHILGYYDNIKSEFFRNNSWDPFFKNQYRAQPGNRNFPKSDS